MPVDAALQDRDAFGLAPLGHNQPPPDDSAALRQRLEEDNAKLAVRRADLLAAAERVPDTIDDDDTARRLSDFLKQISACLKDADKRRVDAKEPFLQGGRVVDGYFKAFIQPVEQADKALRTRLDSYLRAKAEAARREAEAKARAEFEAQERLRKEREAAERAARSRKADEDAKADAARRAEELRRQEAEQAARSEAAAKEAAKTTTEHSRTRGDYGALSSLRKHWTWEVADLDAVPRQFLTVNEAALKDHIRRREQGQPPAPIAGIRFVEETSVAVR